MPKHVLSIKDLGEQASWLLVQQTLGIPDAKARTDFMSERTVVLAFATESFPERLCVTAAVRQMNGFVVYLPHGNWRNWVDEFQHHLMAVIDYYVDCMYVYGLPITAWDTKSESVNFPVINAGSPDGHPAHALADIACMLRHSRYLDGVTAGWVGCANGTLLSLVEATAWFRFQLRVALPQESNAAQLKAKVAEQNLPVTFFDSPEEALQGVDYVFAGCRGDISFEESPRWVLNEKMWKLTKPEARLLLSASPLEAIPVEKAILDSTVSLLTRQAENRLRVHTRLLHWVFSENERAI